MASAASRWGRSCRTRLCGWCSFCRADYTSRRFRVSMPHAALWVVQPRMMVLNGCEDCGFQCRTRLCGWCSKEEFHHEKQCDRFNAARGFVGGATTRRLSLPLAAMSFQCRTRLCGWCSIDSSVGLFATSWFQCRTRLFPFAPTTASRSPSPARAGEAWLGSVFSQNHAISASPADAGEVASAASR